MGVISRIQKGAYFDSVTLMTVGKEITSMEEVVDAAVVMGTAENKRIMAASGLLPPELENAGDSDLLIAVKLADDKDTDAVLAAVDECLKAAKHPPEAGEEVRAASLEGGLQILPGANMAMISVAGKYAGDVAWQALERGLHVMLFSDNVPIETEVALKKEAKSKGLLVMGPDCGTAIINGVPLAFANAVRRGTIGIVAAAGTGLQGVSCIIANEGQGVSQAIGTGGRDVKEAVGGMMFREALAALAEDDQTEVILLVSKPPHESVVKEIHKDIKGIDKPVVCVFLGAKSCGPRMADTLEEAALLGVCLARGCELDEVTKLLADRLKDIQELAKVEAEKRSPGQKYVRGLFSGGTFCTEAQVLFKDLIPDVYSNAPTDSSFRLKDSLKSKKNTVVDLGEDEFTAGRPHPMIDYSLRVNRIKEEADDPETAVILLDVVLGYGSNLDPASELREAVADASKKVAVVCSITGTDQDPQNRSLVEKALKAAGAIVMPTNAAACRLAGHVVELLG